MMMRTNKQCLISYALAVPYRPNMAGGYLRFPWNPRVEPFKGTTQWTISRESGLIVVQDQEWSKSAATALRESFTPTFSPPSKLV